MRSPVFLFLLILSQWNSVLVSPSARRIAGPFIVLSSAVSTRNTTTQLKSLARIPESYGKVPLSFELNEGQVDKRVNFLSRASGYELFLTKNELVFALRGDRRDSAKSRSSTTRTESSSPVIEGLADGHANTGPDPVLRTRLLGTNGAVNLVGVGELEGRVNYFIGDNRAKWHTDIPTYSKVKYESIYPGTDLVYYGDQRQLEYDFIVAPGADPQRIAFEVRGARRISLNAKGDLVLNVGARNLCWRKPVAYQKQNGFRNKIGVHYVITQASRIAFQVSRYDTSQPLYIDPLVYSTYLGGSGDDFGSGIAVDSSGAAYVVGFTASVNFPVTGGAFQDTPSGTDDVFVTKLNTTGSSLVYSTFLGGSDINNGLGIAVDEAGDAYVTGFTTSPDFPTTPGAFQTEYGGGQDGFVSKLDASGSALVYSSYLGGSGQDQGSGIAVDHAGNAFITGFTQSIDFPVSSGAFQAACGNPSTCENAFVTAINSSGSALVYSTYLGGSYDQGYGVTVDSSDNAYVTGLAEAGFPTTPNAFQPTYAGGGDAFVAKINSTGSTLIYSTYLGGSNYDQGYAIAIDQAGDAYITGFTESFNFPVTPGALQMICNEGKSCAKDGDAFVTEINAGGSALIHSTYLGGTKGDYGTGIAVNDSGDAYVTGVTYSKNFPTTSDAVQTKCCNMGSRVNMFVTKLNAPFSALVYSTYLAGIANTEGYGIAVDGAGNAYVTGYTEVGGFPVTSGAFQMTYGGGTSDAFVTKIDPLAATATTLMSSPDPSEQGELVTFIADVTSGLGAPPDGEVISFMKGEKMLGSGILNGGSATFTTSTLKVGTTAVKAVYIGDSNFAGSASKAVKQVVDKTGDR